MSYNQSRVEKLINRYFELLSSVDRKGMKKLIKWLRNPGTGFIDAPASRLSKRHHCHSGGLIEHSLAMHVILGNLIKITKIKLDEDSITIIALLHDICKTGTYTSSEKGYDKDDKYPIGHGEKSIIIVQKFIDLTMDEIMAIRWHMGPFDPAYLLYQNSIESAGYSKLVAAAFSADYISAHLM